MAPIDRIRRTIRNPKKLARFDAALARLADRIEELAAEEGDAQPSILLRVHRGMVVTTRLQRDEEFS